MLEWFNLLDSNLKSVFYGILGAFIGGIIKWFFDQKQIQELTHQIALAIQAQGKTLSDLAAKSNELRQKEERLNQLESLVHDRGITVDDTRARLDALMGRLRSPETGIWTTHPRILPFQDFNYKIARQQPVIITIANLKGGVGKTTLTANLLAYFNCNLKKRILAIDLDYQGSLSTMLRAYQNKVTDRISRVDQLLKTNANHGDLYTASRPFNEKLHRSAFVPAFYELAREEDRLMIGWLLQDEGDDVRYRLANVLLSDEVADKYDVILIDVPPRMSTGTINALCTSTHLLVPTIFNPVSAEPLGNFLQTTKALMAQLNPGLNILGVVETLTPKANEGQDIRQEGRRVIKEALQAFPGVSILGSDVPRRTAIAEGVAYLQNADAKQIFNSLGDEISIKIGLKSEPNAQSAQPRRRAL